jgi:hypothetical protein
MSIFSLRRDYDNSCHAMQTVMLYSLRSTPLYLLQSPEGSPSEDLSDAPSIAL